VEFEACEASRPREASKWIEASIHGLRPEASAHEASNLRPHEASARPRGLIFEASRPQSRPKASIVRPGEAFQASPQASQYRPRAREIAFFDVFQ